MWKHDCIGDSTGLVDCSWLETTNGVSVMVVVEFDSETISQTYIKTLKKGNMSNSYILNPHINMSHILCLKIVSPRACFYIINVVLMHENPRIGAYAGANRMDIRAKMNAIYAPIELRHVITCIFGHAFGEMNVDPFSDVAHLLASRFSVGTIAVCALTPLLCGACANLAAPSR
jgi:hypothetical protein